MLRAFGKTKILIYGLLQRLLYKKITKYFDITRLWAYRAEKFKTAKEFLVFELITPFLDGSSRECPVIYLVSKKNTALSQITLEISTVLDSKNVPNLF